MTTRRKFMGACAVGGATAAAGLPLLNQPAQAASGPPRRLLVMLMPNSNLLNHWIPTGGRDALAGSGVATEFGFNAQNENFELVREHMTLLDGINVKVRPDGDLHSGAVVRFMTGGTEGEGMVNDPGDTSLLGVMPSFDQLLRTESPHLQGTTVPYANMIADSRSDRNNLRHRVLSYDPDAKPIAPELAPHLIHERLFGNAQEMPLDEAARQTAAQREQEIMAFVKGDLGRLNQRLSAAEQAKLQAHLAGLGDLETNVLQRLMTPLEPPPAPPVFEGNVSSDHPAVIEAQLGLIKSAFELDVTRVMTFAFASTNSYVNFDDILGSGFGEGTHSITHTYQGDPDYPQLIEISQWYADITARFLKDLADTPDPAPGATGSILDNTLVVYFTETAQWHEHENIPIILFGGKNLGSEQYRLDHQGGRVLRYPGRWTDDLVPSIAPLFDVHMETFGDAEFNAGPLPELVTTAV